MIAIRLVHLVAAGALACTFASGAQAQECFRGTWVGELSGGGGSLGNARKLIVRPAQGGGDEVRWGLPTTANPQAGTGVEFSGSSLRFTTADGSKVEARCEGKTVSGSWYPLRGGRTSNFTLEKQ